MEQRWLTSEQTAAYLGLTPKALSQMVAKRQIPFTRLGESKRSRLRFDVHQLDQWLESRAVPAGGVTPQ